MGPGYYLVIYGIFVLFGFSLKTPSGRNYILCIQIERSKSLNGY